MNNKYYKTEYFFYEENINGDFVEQPHAHVIYTKEHPTPQNDLDVLFECIEVERINCKHLMVEKTIELVKNILDNDGEYVDSDTAVVEIVYIAYTQELSPYIDWGLMSNETPPIYMVNREKSKVIIHDN